MLPVDGAPLGESRQSLFEQLGRLAQTESLAQALGNLVGAQAQPEGLVLEEQHTRR